MFRVHCSKLHLKINVTITLRINILLCTKKYYLEIMLFFKLTARMSKSDIEGAFSHFRKKCFFTLSSAWKIASGIALTEKKNIRNIYKTSGLLNVFWGKTIGLLNTIKMSSGYEEAPLAVWQSLNFQGLISRI